MPRAVPRRGCRVFRRLPWLARRGSFHRVRGWGWLQRRRPPRPPRRCWVAILRRTHGCEIHIDRKKERAVGLTNLHGYGRNLCFVTGRGSSTVLPAWLPRPPSSWRRRPERRNSRPCTPSNRKLTVWRFSGEDDSCGNDLRKAGDVQTLPKTHVVNACHTIQRRANAARNACRSIGRRQTHNCLKCKTVDRATCLFSRRGRSLYRKT